jgi:hypothetical protein
MAPLSPRAFRHSDAAMTAEIGYHADAFRGFSLDARAFARLDEKDPERTRFDLPALRMEYRADAWAWEAGASQVFWGVAESRHLVDIVNQVDWSGDLEGEEKLGQPMVRITWDHPRAGLLEALGMTFFRPRPFPGESGRPGLPFPLQDDDPRYASGLGRWHPDLALRWSHHYLGFDWALSGFAGTSREPRFRTGPGAAGFPVVPYYDLIRQGAAELQFTSGAWLWKVEALARRGQGPYFTALTGGLEYQVQSAWPGTGISLFAEYNRDTRRNGTFNVLDNDLFAGARIAWSPPTDTEIEAGAFIDMVEGTLLGKTEARRRFRDVWLASAAGRYFSIEEDGILKGFRRDHHLELELRRVF